MEPKWSYGSSRGTAVQISPMAQREKHDLKDLVGHNCKVSLFQVALIFSSRLGKYFVCGETALAGRDLALVRPTRRNGRQNPFHIADHVSMMVNGSWHM